MNLKWNKINSFSGNRTSPLLSYYRPCPVCGSTQSRTIWSTDSFQFFSDDIDVHKRIDLRVHLCSRCFALFLNPCYSNFGFKELFSEAGQSYGSSDLRPSEQLQWLSERGLLQSSNAVLDVGCFDGRFLALLPPSLKKIGVDIDKGAINRGREVYAQKGIEFILGDLESFRFGGKVDLILMFHVLEHLANPVAVLRNLRSMSHKDTVLVLEVPILENGMTNDINGFLSVQHMTHFSKKSLENCLRAAGWDVIECQEQDAYNGYRVMAKITNNMFKIQADRSDLSFLYGYLSSWYEALQKVESIVKNIKDDRLVIWGAGLHTEFLYQTTSLFQPRNREYVIVDSDPLKQGKSWRGISIHSSEVLAEEDLTGVQILISSYGSQNKILEAINEISKRPPNVITLYEHLRVY